MRNLIAIEFRQSRISFWIALVLIVALQAIPAVAAKSYIENNNKKDAIVGEVQSGEIATVNDMLSTFEGWVSGQPFTFLLLIFGSFAMNWAINSIVKEKDRKTMEFLFAMPHSRTSIYLAKWITTVIQVLIISVSFSGIVLLVGKGTNIMNNPWAVCGVMLAGLLTTLSFMGIGFLLTPWLKTERGALSAGIGIVFAMFLFSVLSSLQEKMNWLSGISLFNLFDAYSISQGNGLSLNAVIVAIVIFLVGSVAGWLKLIRQDL
ncbi:ABC-2 family transporter protein [compost metagenome]